MINITPILDDIADTASDDQTVDTGAAEAVSLNGMRKAAAKAKKPAKAKAVKGNAKQEALLAKAAKARKEKAAKVAPVAKAKAAKPAAAEPVADTACETLVEQLLAEYIGGDIRTDNSMRALFRKAYEAGKAAPRIRAPRAGGPTKRELAAELLTRKEGCTSRDILDATGWPTVSVPAVARASGLTLRQEKQGRTTVYFGTRA